MKPWKVILSNIFYSYGMSLVFALWATSTPVSELCCTNHTHHMIQLWHVHVHVRIYNTIPQRNFGMCHLYKDHIPVISCLHFCTNNVCSIQECWSCSLLRQFLFCKEVCDVASDNPTRVLGRAWASPALNVTTAFTCELMIPIYLSIILPRVCRTLVPEICACTSWNAPCILVYWHALYNCMHSTAVLNSKDDWNYSCLPWFLSMKTGRWMRRHMV